MILYKEDKNQLDDICAFIDTNLHAKLSANTLAKHFDIPTYTLRRKFIDAFDKPLQNYIHECRMNKAKDVLVNNLMTVSEAAFLVGYNDVSSFSHSFTKRFKRSPQSCLKK